MTRMTTSSIRIMATGLIVLGALSFLSVWAHANPRPGKTVSFDPDWRFHLGDVANGQDPNLDDSIWRELNLPHDWSIEGEFDEKKGAPFTLAPPDPARAGRMSMHQGGIVQTQKGEWSDRARRLERDEDAGGCGSPPVTAGAAGITRPEDWFYL